MSEVLYRKYRPQKFQDVIGQEMIVQVIKQGLVSGNFPHAYLFTGPRGTGKTSMARLVAVALNCAKFLSSGDICGECEACIAHIHGTALDLVEIDAASNRGIEEIRTIRENVHFSPTSGRYKIYIIDEVHMLTREAFNALLKTLEEPPAHAVFILATTEPHKVPLTIQSRVQRFDFRLASQDDLGSKLNKIASAEGLQLANEAITLIFEYSGGSFRDSESLLGKIISNLANHDNKVTEAMVYEVLGIADASVITQLVGVLQSGEAAALPEVIDNLKSLGVDPGLVLRQVQASLRNGVIAQVRSKQDFTQDLDLLRRIISASNDFRTVEFPFLHLELVLLQSIQARSLPKAAAAAVVQPLSKNLTVVKAVEQGEKKPRTQPNLVVDDGSESKKWDAILDRAKAKSFKLWTLLRVYRPEVEDTILLLKGGFESTKTELENSEHWLFITEECMHLFQVESIKIVKSPNQEIVREIHPVFGNTNLVESIFN